MTMNPDMTYEDFLQRAKEYLVGYREAEHRLFDFLCWVEDHPKIWDTGAGHSFEHVVTYSVGIRDHQLRDYQKYKKAEAAGARQYAPPADVGVSGFIAIGEAVKINEQAPREVARRCIDFTESNGLPPSRQTTLTWVKEQKNLATGRRLGTKSSSTLLSENERLRKENERLVEENKTLRVQISTLRAKLANKKVAA